MKDLLGKEAYNLACIECGAEEYINLVTHRRKKKVVGILCVCDDCTSKYLDSNLLIILEKKVKNEKENSEKEKK